MPTIKTYKNYSSLVTFGCSFTGGHVLGTDGAWGHFLANKLNCNHINRAGGASNTNILNNVINFCENNDMSNSCVGIQWSELTRREFWDANVTTYQTTGLGALLDLYHNRNNFIPQLHFVRDNISFFSNLWFDIRENVLRTIVAMLQAKAYLEYKNIDFIMFEGINSIKNIKEYSDITYDITQQHDLGLLNTNIKLSILNSDTFFSELGDLNTAMKQHPKFDASLNDGHPHPEILTWWVDALYKHLQRVENEL